VRHPGPLAVLIGARFILSLAIINGLLKRRYIRYQLCHSSISNRKLQHHVPTLSTSTTTCPCRLLAFLFLIPRRQHQVSCHPNAQRHRCNSLDSHQQYNIYNTYNRQPNVKAHRYTSLDSWQLYNTYNAYNAYKQQPNGRPNVATLLSNLLSKPT
jgi:hypothetical protein